MNRNKRGMRIASITVCGALVLAGSIGISAASASAKKPKESAIVVGAIGQYSGALGSSFAGIPPTLKAWADSLNAKGGLDGHKVDVVIKDIAAGTAAAGLTAAESLVTQNHVEAVFDSDSGDATWIPYLKSHGVPVIEMGTDGSSTLKYSNAFENGPAQIPSLYAIVGAALASGGKLAIGYCAESPGCAQLPSLFGVLGLTPTVSAAISSSSPDYTAFCEAVKTSGATSYILFLPLATSVEVTDQCYQDKLTIPQILIAGNVDSTVKYNPAYTGDLVTDTYAQPFWNTHNATIRAIQTALAKYTKGIVGTSLDNVYAEAAWASASLLALDVSHIKVKVTASSILKGMAALKNVSPGGLTAPETIVNKVGTPTYCSYEWTIGNGVFKVGTAGTPVQLCAPAATVDPILASMG